MSPGTVLLIADDAALRDVLQRALSGKGCRVVAATDPHEAMSHAATYRPDLVAVSSRFGTCAPIIERLWEEIYQEHAPCVVIAPDPFPQHQDGRLSHGRIASISEYATSFARAVLNLLAADRNAKVELNDEIEWQGLHLDRIGYRATVAGRSLDLTLTEFNILWALAQQPDRVRTREELVEASRGAHSGIKTRTIDVHIKSLRRKLGVNAGLIATIRGIGYRLHPPRCSAVP